MCVYSYYAWGGMFSERGYTAVEIDIEAPTESNSSSESLQVMAKGELHLHFLPIFRYGTNNHHRNDPSLAELSQQIRLMAIPFPPVIISTGPSTLLSQTFISDFPASALVMINPPSNESSLLQPTSGVDSESIDAAPKAGFTYEPHFPIYILSTGDKADDVAQHRLVRLHADKGVGRAMRGVTYEQAEGGKAERSEGTRMMVERWLDRCGY
jgi:hypothetical protein